MSEAHGHIWIPNTPDGQKRFRMRTMVHPTDPVMPVKCAHEGCLKTTWFTEDEWTDMPVTRSPDE